MFRYFYDELVQNIDKMPLALNLKLFVKNTIEFMDELVSLNKIWETDNLASGKDEEEDNASDIEIIEPEQNKEGGQLEEKKDILVLSDEDNLDDEEIIEKLRNIQHQLSEEVNDKETTSEDDANQEVATNFNVDKLNELTAFVSKCAPVEDKDVEERSSTDDEGKFSDGDDDNEKIESEEILKSFVREISQERKMENLMETDEGEVSS